MVQFVGSFHEVKVFQSTYIEAEPKRLIITQSSSRILFHFICLSLWLKRPVSKFLLVNSFGTEGHMTVATPTTTSPVPSLYKHNKRRRNDNHESEVLPALLASLSQTAAAGSRVVSLQGGARRPALLNLFFFSFSLPREWPVVRKRRAPV